MPFFLVCPLQSMLLWIFLVVVAFLSVNIRHFEHLYQENSKKYSLTRGNSHFVSSLFFFRFIFNL